MVRVKKFYARLKESARKHHGKSADRAGIRRACTHVAAAAERLVAALYPGAPFQVRAKFRVSVCVSVCDVLHVSVVPLGVLARCRPPSLHLM